MTESFNNIEDNVERFVWFVTEREHVRVSKERGYPWPWTQDHILQTYRFCNIHREDDAVTRWVAQYWREPYKNDPDLWHLMCVARLLNNVETLKAVGAFARPFAQGWGFPYKLFCKGLRSRKAAGHRIFNPAYMITTAGKKQDKIEYIADLLQELWQARERMRPKSGDTLCSYHMLLGTFSGLGSFLAGQVVADLRYVNPLLQASDLHTFAASGPGSRRGMNRIRGRPVKVTWVEDDWRLDLQRLLRKTAPALRRVGISLHGQDLQNCLCEFDKYERARLGEGKPKQLYRHKHA